MSLSAEELLKPRFEVLQEYPSCPFSKGDILNRLKNATNDWYDIDECSIKAKILLDDIEKYPHLFRKLNWWEYRKVEDMPKKLICKAIPEDTEIMYIEEWDMNILFGWTCAKSRTGFELLSFNYDYGYFPID